MGNDTVKPIEQNYAFCSMKAILNIELKIKYNTVKYKL